VSGSDRPQDPVVLGRDGVLYVWWTASRLRNALLTPNVYPETGHRSIVAGGLRAMQISRPRDVGPLVLVVGMLLILLVVTLTIAPQR
jgi:hypothetical protein